MSLFAHVYDEVFMCFLYASPDELDSLLEKAIEYGHCIVAVSDKPLADGRHLITTIKPGDPTW